MDTCRMEVCTSGEIRFITYLWVETFSPASVWTSVHLDIPLTTILGLYFAIPTLVAACSSSSKGEVPNSERFAE